MLWCSLALYGAALLLPAYMPMTNGAPGEKYFGWMALLIGPLGVLGGHFSWFANPCLWFAWSKLHKRDDYMSLWGSIPALAMALTFLLYDSMPVGSSGVFDFTILIAYYVWIASIVAALVGALMIPTSPTAAADAP